MTVSLDWENLGFSYMKLPYRYLAYYRNGAWEKGELTEDATLHLSESSPSLHYGQQAFEGLKAYRTKRWKHPIVPSRSKRQTFATHGGSFADASSTC